MQLELDVEALRSETALEFAPTPLQRFVAALVVDVGKEVGEGRDGAPLPALHALASKERQGAVP